jgi:uncharacterized protein YbaR (Trm112 family)
MHLSLSDLLICPRCGPEWGLILLPAEVVERRVRTGVLGCASCRHRYPIEGGIADLRLDDTAGADHVPAGAVGAAARGEPGSEAALRLGALLGLAETRGAVVLAGPASAHAGSLAALLDGVEVVVVGEAPASGDARVADLPGVSRVLATGRLPFRTGSLAAVAATGPAAGLVEEALRVVRPAGRVLAEPSDQELAARAETAGGARVVAEGDTLVLARRR